MAIKALFPVGCPSNTFLLVLHVEYTHLEYCLKMLTFLICASFSNQTNQKHKKKTNQQNKCCKIKSLDISNCWAAEGEAAEAIIQTKYLLLFFVNLLAITLLQASPAAVYFCVFVRAKYLQW